jgi:hypothetical protein
VALFAGRRAREGGPGSGFEFALELCYSERQFCSSQLDCCRNDNHQRNNENSADNQWRFWKIFHHLSSLAPLVDTISTWSRANPKTQATDIDNF